MVTAFAILAMFSQSVFEVIFSPNMLIVYCEYRQCIDHTWENCWWLSRRWSDSCSPRLPQTPRIIRPSDRGWMYDKWMQIKMIKTNRIMAETIGTGRAQSARGKKSVQLLVLSHTPSTHCCERRKRCWCGIDSGGRLVVFRIESFHRCLDQCQYLVDGGRGRR